MKKTTYIVLRFKIYYDIVKLSSTDEVQQKEGKGIMRKEEENTKALVEQLEVEEEVEGYEYCESKKEKCLNDCIWGIGGKASMVDIN